MKIVMFLLLRYWRNEECHLLGGEKPYHPVAGPPNAKPHFRGSECEKDPFAFGFPGMNCFALRASDHGFNIHSHFHYPYITLIYPNILLQNPI